MSNVYSKEDVFELARMALAEDENIENDQLIGMAKVKLRRIAGAFPVGAQSFKVISRCGHYE